MSTECSACEIGRSCKEHNPSRSCGCVEGETCIACRVSTLLLVEDAYREGLLRKAEREAENPEVQAHRAYWQDYVNIDSERLGEWRSLMPYLVRV